LAWFGFWFLAFLSESVGKKDQFFTQDPVKRELLNGYGCDNQNAS